MRFIFLGLCMVASSFTQRSLYFSSEIYKQTNEGFKAMGEIVDGGDDLASALPSMNKLACLKEYPGWRWGGTKGNAQGTTETIQDKDELEIKQQVMEFMKISNQNLKDIIRGVVLASPVMQKVKGAEQPESFLRNVTCTQIIGCGG